MGASYLAVGWNRQKKIYDWLIFGFCILYLTTFIVLTAIFNPDYTFETLLMFYFNTGCIAVAYYFKHWAISKNQ